MKRTPLHPGANRDGFTLIEIIVTIVISAILATILAQVVSNQTARSYAPLVTVDENLALRAVIENITAEYRQLTQMGSVDLDSFGAAIQAGDFQDTALTNDIAITADYGCIPMNDTGGEATTAYCTSTDAVLKITLAVQDNPGHRLTALFTQR